MLMLFFFPPGDQGLASLSGIRLSLKTGKSRAWLLVYVVYSNRNVLSGDLFYVELETVSGLTGAWPGVFCVHFRFTCHIVCMTSTALLRAVEREAPVCIRALILTFPNLQEVQIAYKVRGVCKRDFIR